MMTALPDGRYDVFVVDAETDDDDTIRLELAVVSGAQKGEVVVIRGARSGRDPLDLLGLPGTLTVADGAPRFEVERGG